MAEFNEDYLEMYLGAVRKYMQVRGSLTQKDLAEMCEIGVSTMSRFLGKKTTELNPQLIAKIVAKLAIPLHEIIDFVDESYTDKFVRLVKFYKDEQSGEDSTQPVDRRQQKAVGSRRHDDDLEDADDFDLGLTEALSTGTAKRNATANVKIGGKSRNISFSADEGNKNSEESIKEKLANLSPRQKAYMADFLNLDVEGRDLIVDIGNSLLRYFKHKGMDF